MDIQTKDGILLRGIPDGTPDEAIKARIDKIRAEKGGAMALEGVGGLEKFRIGMGKAFSDLGKGASQLVNMGPNAKETEEGVARDAPLMTGAGLAGDIAGNVAAFAPAMLLPGAGTVAGAGALGATMAAMSPSKSPQERLGKMAIGGAVGAGSQWAGTTGATLLGERAARNEASAEALKQTNAVRDQTVEVARKAGYVMPPSEVNSTNANQLLSWPSGKIMTQQAASVKNQPVTDQLARQDLGLNAVTPLSPATFQTLRKEAAAAGYEPLKQTRIQWTPEFVAAKDALTAEYRQMVQENPAMRNPGVENLVQKLDVKSISGNTAIAMTRDLRNEASKAFRTGDNVLGSLYKKSALAVEDLMGQNLSMQGKQDALQAFQSARQTIAKSHAYEDALIESGGHIDARKLASMMKSGDYLSGNQKVIASFAEQFRQSAQPLSSMQQLTAVDALLGAGLPGAIIAAATGNPAGLLAGAAIPAARLGSRSLVLSGPYQNNMLTPSYSPGALANMDRLGLLPSPEIGGMIGRQAIPGLLSYEAMQR